MVITIIPQNASFTSYGTKMVLLIAACKTTGEFLHCNNSEMPKLVPEDIKAMTLRLVGA